MVLLRQLAAIFFLSSHCTVYTTVSFDFSIGPESIVVWLPVRRDGFYTGRFPAPL